MPRFSEIFAPNISYISYTDLILVIISGILFEVNFSKIQKNLVNLVLAHSGRAKTT